MIEKRVTGNYEMNLVLTGEPTTAPVKIFFAGDTTLGKRAYLAISADELKVARETGTDTRTWKTYNNIGKTPWNVKILKKGNFLGSGSTTRPVGFAVHWVNGKTFMNRWTTASALRHHQVSNSNPAL